MKKAYIHPEERYNNVEDYDTQLEKQRKYHKNDKDLEDLEECTFKPKLMSKKKQKGRRNVEDLFQWNREKDQKNMTMRLLNGVGEKYTFAPEIDPKSQKLAKRKKRRSNVENRLIKAGEEKKERIN